MKCEECGLWVQRMRKTLYYTARNSFLVFLAAAIVSFVLYCFWNMSQADGKIDYCYIDYEDRLGDEDFHLYGNIEWSGDRELGEYESLIDAADAAKVLKCKLGFLEGDISYVKEPHP